MKNKLNYKKLPASLFDLPQDIIEHMPIDLIDRWIKSDQSPKTAQKLLSAYVVRGVAVSSDSAGLSRLSQGKNLIEVLSLINEPKDYIYNHGIHVGGKSVGIWSADNTQMFYPSKVKPEEVVTMLHNLQKNIAHLEVKIGLGAHLGRYYRIAGGLYGDEADFIEGVAEGYSKGGEIVLTEQLVKKINVSDKFRFICRKDLKFDFSKIFTLADAPEMQEEIGNDKMHPIPYSHAFYHGIKKYYLSRDQRLLKSLEKKYLVNKTIVLIEREKEDIKNAELEILDNFSLFAIASKTSLELIKKYQGDEVKSGGNLSIYTFDNPKKALRFAEIYQKELSDQGLKCKIGIDQGPVMIFKIKKGTRDIAGIPINIASKISQDQGKMGHIYITQSIFEATRPIDYKKRNTHVSGISIENYFK